MSSITLDKAQTQGVCCCGFQAGSVPPRSALHRRLPSCHGGAGWLALRVHGVHGHGRLEVVAVMERGVGQAVVVELVA